MKAYLFLVTALFVISPAYAQRPRKTTQPKIQPCTVSVDDAPSLQGFYLGMSVEEVKAKRPGTVREQPKAPTPPLLMFLEIGELSAPDEYGTQRLQLRGEREDVESVNLSFVDGLVSEVRVYYDSSVKWDGLAEFTSKTAEAFKLPRLSAWERVGSEGQLTCAGFIVKTGMMSTGKGTYVSVESLADDAVIEARKREAERKKKEAFKP